VGSQSKVDLAYIAGFLDGDGSLMLQLKKCGDRKSNLRFMCTICFYQDSRHREPLVWIRKVLNIGYLSDRKDGITELRVNGYRQIHSILVLLLPYLKFKKTQASCLVKACELLIDKSFRKLNEDDLRTLVSLILEIQSQNYVTKKKKTGEELLKILGLTP